MGTVKAENGPEGPAGPSIVPGSSSGLSKRNKMGVSVRQQPEEWGKR